MDGSAVQILSPDDGYQYFFGYYDLQPFDASGRYHLCHRVSFMDRLPRPEDVAELGILDTAESGFIKLTETTAWNFQQGALLRWYGDDRIAYNVREGDGFASELLHIPSGSRRRLPLPFADISPDGRYALCINFSRIYDFRPGYGYAGVPDRFAAENAPAADGITLMDMQTGETRLLVSYRRLRELFPQPPYSDGKLLVNHINFSPDGRRFVFLLRNFPMPGQSKWKTLLAVGDTEGNFTKLTDFCANSHYHWKNDRELLIVSSVETEQENYALHLFDAVTGAVPRLPEPNPTEDIHCLYSPDRQLILGDGYPDPANRRAVWLIDPVAQTQQKLLECDSPPPANVDIRCDLHVRFDRRGESITFDSTHTGKRTVCRFPIPNRSVRRNS